MDAIEKRLAELGLSLPATPAAAGNYLPWRISGRQLFLSGVIAMRDGAITHAGAVGAERTEAEGYEAARVCALNALANMKAALGSLERVSQVLLVNGFVNAVAGFANSPQVINGASDLLVQALGDKGKHARTAVAVAGLPRGSTVEIQMVVEFE